MQRLILLLSLGAFACSSSAEPAAKTTPAAPPLVAARDAGAPALVASAAPKAAPGFGVVAEGTCSDYRAFAVGEARVLATTGMVYQLDGSLLDGHSMYNDMTGAGIDAVAEVIDVGGPDLEHVWINRMTASRSSDTVYLRVRSGDTWTTPQAPADYGFGPVAYAHPSGALWIASNPMLAASRFEEFVDGVLVKKPKMPNLGMIGGEYGFMPDGELLVVGAGAYDSGSGKAQLRRWSPTHPVNDVLVAAKYSHKPPMTLRIQPNSSTPRVVVGIGSPLGPNKKGALFDWKNEKLVPVAMAAQLTAPFASDLAPDGTLYALLDDGTLLRESAAGEVSKVMVPEGGTVVAKRTNDPWIVGKAGGLFRLVKGAITPVPLPGGAWEQAEHTAPLAKRVMVLGPEEAYVVATRTDRGDGWKKPRTTTVLYANAAVKAPLRCGAPLGAGTVIAFPPAATASCPDPYVVIDKAIKPAALKPLGDAGAPLSFGTGKMQRAALKAPSLDTAKAWAKTLSMAGNDSEIVCGAPSSPPRN